jgi:hypothetical protein
MLSSPCPEHIGRSSCGPTSIDILILSTAGCSFNQPFARHGVLSSSIPRRFSTRSVALIANARGSSIGMRPHIGWQSSSERQPTVFVWGGGERATAPPCHPPPSSGLWPWQSLVSSRPRPWPTPGGRASRGGTAPLNHPLPWSRPPTRSEPR